MICKNTVSKLDPSMQPLLDSSSNTSQVMIRAGKTTYQECISAQFQDVITSQRIRTIVKGHLYLSNDMVPAGGESTHFTKF